MDFAVHKTRVDLVSKVGSMDHRRWACTPTNRKSGPVLGCHGSTFSDDVSDLLALQIKTLMTASGPC